MNAIAQKILDEILAGQRKHGEVLPEYDDLLQTHACDEATLESALGELIYEGWLERNPINRNELRVLKHPLGGTLTGNHSLTKEALKRGLEPGVRILTFETVPNWPIVRERLRLDPDDLVIIMERLRTVGGLPISLEYSYYPEKFYPGMTIEMFTAGGEGQSSFKVMQDRFNLIPQHALDEVTVAAVEEREAALLGIDRGTPVLIRLRLTISDKGVPIKGSRAICLFKAGYTLPI